MKIFRGYSDKTASETLNTFADIFGKATDTSKPTTIEHYNAVIGFPAGAVSIPLPVLAAGNTPFDMLVTNGAANVPGGGAFTRAKFSKVATDLSEAVSVAPGTPAASIKFGNGPKQHHAYPEIKPGEQWYLNAQSDTAFWLVLNTTAH